MSWPCYIVEEVPQEPPLPDPERPGVRFTVLFRTPDGELLPFNKLKVGAIYRDARTGIRVKLPGYSGQNRWDMEAFGGDGDTWNVSGEIPNVTATPSINCVGVYHGWVTNGVVTDDCDGRKFDDVGRAA